MTRSCSRMSLELSFAIFCTFISVVACVCAFAYGKRVRAFIARKGRHYMPRNVNYKYPNDRVKIAEDGEKYFEVFVPMKGKMMCLVPICSRMKSPRAIVIPMDLAPLRTRYR